MEQPQLLSSSSSSRAVVVYFFLYCLVSSSLLFNISAVQGYKQHVNNSRVNDGGGGGGTRSVADQLLIKSLSSPSSSSSSSSNLDFMELLFPESHFNCEGVVNFTQKRGFIKSPHYPNGYSVPLLCRWNIIGAVDEIITISFSLIDIEIPSESPIQCYRSAEFQASRCCARNYLKITSSGSSGSLSRAPDQQQSQAHLYCGDSSLQQRAPFTSTSNVVAVEFNALENVGHARGFYLEYSIHPRRRSSTALGPPSALLTSASEGSGVAGPEPPCAEGQFRCSTSRRCIDAERRCNGVADCDHQLQETLQVVGKVKKMENSFSYVPDFSDELNCTSQLCRPEKGAFLCSDGRCILSPWSCDHDCSDEKGTGSGGGSGCMKNSVITAAIIGSLVCLLLIVIAISCAIRLFGLRHSGQYRSSLAGTSTAGHFSTSGEGGAGGGGGGGGHHHRSSSSSSHHHHSHNWPPSPFTADSLPFPAALMGTGDLDASLFRLDHALFLREPPPSYASTMGGYADVPGSGGGGGGLGGGGSASYMEQYRRYRRQRRCRRLLRRQQRMAAGGAAAASGVGGCGSSDASPPPALDGDGLGGCGEDVEIAPHHRTSRNYNNHHHYNHHHNGGGGHQFVNPLPPLSPTTDFAVSLLQHMQEFPETLRRSAAAVAAAVAAGQPLSALLSADSEGITTGSTALPQPPASSQPPPPPPPPPLFQANLLQESCFEGEGVGGEGSSSFSSFSSSKKKKKKNLNHLNLQCNSLTEGGGGSAGGAAVASTTFGVLPFSAAAAAAASVALPSSAAASTSLVAGASASSAAAASTETALTIELEPIPPLTNFIDCDSLPLIR